MMHFLFDLLMWPIEKMFDMAFSRATSTNGQDDPAYQKNLENLIERNRKFEKPE